MKTVTTFKEDHNHYLNPLYSVDECLSILKRQGLSTVILILEESSELILVFYVGGFFDEIYPCGSKAEYIE